MICEAGHTGITIRKYQPKLYICSHQLGICFKLPSLKILLKHFKKIEAVTTILKFFSSVTDR